MKVLFSFVGGRGHLEPLLPLAHAVREAGHQVGFACAPSMLSSVQAAGFRRFALGRERPRAPERIPLRPVDPAREERDLRERFARRAARYRLPLLLELLGAWRPALVVCDETDFGAMLAAEKLGLPCATVEVIATGAFVRAEVVAEALDALRAEHGLPSDPELAMPGRHLVLSSFPPSFRDPAHPPHATLHGFRPALLDATLPSDSPWPHRRADTPRVYLTLGTVFPLESGDLLVRLVAGLRQLPIELLVTVGPELSPSELGPQPAHVRVERYVPQAAVLPECSLVVSHGGSGSVLGALAWGLPSLLVPLGADQPLNAARCRALGVSITLDAVAATPEQVAAAARELFETPRYRRDAGKLRDELAALPPIEQALPLLEALG